MDEIEKRIVELIDERKEEIIAFARDIYAHGELSFYEVRTAKKVEKFFGQLGLTIEKEIAVTGVKAWAGGDAKDVNLCILGELDGIQCKTHPFSNAENGISHACGHHAQLAALIGSAIALCHPEIQKYLDGNITFFAVPAEEYVDASIKEELKSQGKIKFGSGKSEAIRIGAFDDIDLVLTTHVHMVPCDKDILIGNNASNGFVSKRILIKGKASHAAIAPGAGINALNAAAHGLNAIGFLRETFPEEDYIRVHSIIQKGGTAVNVIPDEVVVEAMVRAKSLAAIETTANKVDKAFTASAEALGAKAEITNYQGYLPVLEAAASKAMLQAAACLEHEITFEPIHMGYQNVASTDVGDLTHVKPVINFTHGGFQGALHSEDFTITDEYKAYIIPAKIMALSAYRLLAHQAKEAKEVIQEFHPVFTREEYVSYINTLKGGE